MKLFKTLILSFCIFIAAHAYVWNVPDSVLTIQSAIDTAASGDTVMVKNPFQNDGSIEIINKQIALLSKSYINNPSAYTIASGAAIYNSDNTVPLVKINNAGGSEIRGFLFDDNDLRSGGGIIIEGSDNIIIDGVHFQGNSLVVDNASLEINNAAFYSNDTADYSLISIINGSVDMSNTQWRDSEVASLLVMGAESEFRAENLAVYNNDCTNDMYIIGSTSADFNYFTSYGNTTSASAWTLNSTWLNISNSVLENAPPVDISQCEITYSAVPGSYPGTGNISEYAEVDTSGSYPALLETSPCISAANPDTTEIPRTDILGNARPNPEWAPPDMGAYESERHMLLNDDTRLWISKTGHDIWGNGSDEYPFASIQAAIDYALEADTLLLLPGTYASNVLIEGKSLTIASEFILNQNGAYKDSVILVPDTSIADPILLVRNTDSLLISGMTLREGRGRQFYNNYSFGGAIYCEDSGLRLEYSDLEENTSEYSGGALYALNSEVFASEVRFMDNLSYLGGAISLSASTGYFANVTIRDNIASSGGGIYLEDESMLIAYYAEISENFANNDSLDDGFAKPAAISQYGAGIYAVGSHLRLHNSLISANRSVNQGAALALKSGALYLLQSTIVDNYSSADSTASIYLDQLSEDALIVNSILYDQNEDELILKDSDLLTDHSFISGGEDGIIHIGSENIVIFDSVLTGDPDLDEDYNLTLGSQCLNAGLSSFLLDDEYLINYDESEYDGTAPDLGHNGAYPEIPFLIEPVESSIETVPESYELLKAYPNPFNPICTIEFNLDTPGKTNLSVFDISGRRVSTLVDRDMSNGNYKLVFNAHSLPSGIYIARLTQKSKVLSTSKLCLVK